MSIAFAAHLHGRDLLVERPAGADDVAPPGGSPARGVTVPLVQTRVGSTAIAMGSGTPRWHWQVVAPCGRVLAEGDAPDRRTAEEAAEDEVEAIHPPSDDLIDALLR